MTLFKLDEMSLTEVEGEEAFKLLLVIAGRGTGTETVCNGDHGTKYRESLDSYPPQCGICRQEGRHRWLVMGLKADPDKKPRRPAGGVYYNKRVEGRSGIAKLKGIAE